MDWNGKREFLLAFKKTVIRGTNIELIYRIELLTLNAKNIRPEFNFIVIKFNTEQWNQLLKKSFIEM